MEHHIPNFQQCRKIPEWNSMQNTPFPNQPPCQIFSLASAFLQTIAANRGFFITKNNRKKHSWTQWFTKQSTLKKNWHITSTQAFLLHLFYPQQLSTKITSHPTNVITENHMGFLLPARFVMNWHKPNNKGKNTNNINSTATKKTFLV